MGSPVDPITLPRRRCRHPSRKVAIELQFSSHQPAGQARPLLENQVGIDRVAPCHLRNRNTRRSRLATDRPLLLIRPKPLRPTRHACTLVSTIVGGHYPAPADRGRAVRRDAHATTVFTAFLRTSRPLASTVLPRVLETQTPPRRAACKHLILRRFLVAGVGFEPTTFRL